MWDPSPASSPNSETNGRPIGPGIFVEQEWCLGFAPTLAAGVARDHHAQGDLVEAGDGDGDAGRERESNAMAAARTASGRPRPFHDERRQGDLDGAFRDLPGTWIVCVCDVKMGC
jgi:hypothetical protein